MRWTVQVIFSSVSGGENFSTYIVRKNFQEGYDTSRKDRQQFHSVDLPGIIAYLTTFGNVASVEFERVD